MSLAPKEFFSNDVGAPQLTGTAGSLIAVLDAVLVNGYGSRSPLGWTKPFSGTNLAAYRNNPSFGSGYYLRFSDTNAQVTAVRGYEAMTDVNTGTGMFPLAAQQAADTFIGKSVAASATVRPWAVFGNARCFYLFIGSEVDTVFGVNTAPFFFGDVNTYRAGDTGAFCIPFGVNTATTALLSSTQNTRCFVNGYSTHFFDGVSSGLWFAYMARSFGGAPLPIGASMVAPGATSTNFGSTLMVATFPMGGVNALPLSRALVLEQQFNGVLRGEMPGVYIPLVSLINVPNLSTVTNVGDLPGGTVLRHMRFNAPATNTSGPGSVLFDITNNW